MKLQLAFLTLLIASPLEAQRSLHWSDLQVDATLQSDGTLHVTERQTMVFTGDWNGGERRFDIRPRQLFEFDGMVRLDSTGSHGMRRGSLADVDGFDFTDKRTLRWRSRLPSDPPFDKTQITYLLEYALGNVLVTEGDGFVLDHDFAFADRAGPIEKLQVRLKLDSAWQPSAAFAGTWQGTNLPPGEGFVVRVPLRYIGAGDGPDASVGAEPIERAIIGAVLLLLLGSIGKRLYTREKSTGRLDPLPSPEVVNEKWLDEHLLAHLPEVVGAAWDNSTGASEVSALLARMVADGRMRSEVKPGGTFKDPVLHLELLVDRSRFHGYEQRLIDALFEPGETTTDTASMRERYKQSGFDPAEKIKKPLTDLVKAMVPGKSPSKPSALPSLFSFLLAIALLVAAVVNEPADAPLVFIGVAMIIMFYFIALGGAAAWRNRVHDVTKAAAWFVVPMTIPLVGLLVVIATGATLASALALAGLAVLYGGLANSVFHMARTRENQERVAFRRRLAVARQYFINELRSDKPRLKDSWFPYLMAFGLAKHMDKWFAAFGGASEPSLATVSHSSGSHGHSSGSSSGGGWSGFGGGGGFSGGGASASWAAAAGAMASGISAPSSSSGSSGGGGGGGGGGSSGGGGGGGW